MASHHLEAGNAALHSVALGEVGEFFNHCKTNIPSLFICSPKFFIDFSNALVVDAKTMLIAGYSTFHQRTVAFFPFPFSDVGVVVAFGFVVPFVITLALVGEAVVNAHVTKLAGITDVGF
jgi:hypothetical protein